MLWFNFPLGAPEQREVPSCTEDKIEPQQIHSQVYTKIRTKICDSILQYCYHDYLCLSFFINVLRRPIYVYSVNRDDRSFSLTWPVAMQIFETKGSVYIIRKEFNSHRIGLVHQHGHRFIVLEHQYGCRNVM